MTWTKVDKGESNFNKVDKTAKKGWFEGGWFLDWFGGIIKGLWSEIDKGKTNCNEVSKDTSSFVEVDKAEGNWTETEKE